MTPLIDVVLVLLIVFMVVTPPPVHDLPVHLSGSERTADPGAVAPTQVIVRVSGAGELQVNEKVVASTEYEAQLRGLLQDRQAADKVVFVMASDQLNYGVLVGTIEKAKRAGATAIGFATHDEE